MDIALQNWGGQALDSEEETLMLNKVKAGLILGAMVLFSVAAQAAFIVNPYSTHAPLF